jgi:hypothetical protein
MSFAGENHLDAAALHRIKERAALVYNQECVASGKAIYSPQLGHKCDGSCTRRHLSGFPMPVSICTLSWMVHLCGQQYCSETELPASGGCYVCRLTGLCFDSEYKHYVTYSKQTPGKRVGGDRIKMGSVGPKKKPRVDEDGVVLVSSPKCLSQPARIDRIKYCLKTFLTDSPERVLIHRKQMQRFYREDLKKFRASRRPKEPVGIVDVYLGIVHNIEEMGAALNPPATNLTPVHLDTLAVAFNDYFSRLVDVSARAAITLREEALHIPSTQRQIEVFTACMCNFLAKGFSIEGTVVVTQDPWFAFHAPHIKDYGGFECMGCRPMSRFERVFQNICIAPSSQTVLYSLKFQLPESFTSRWHRKPSVSMSSSAATTPPTPTTRAIKSPTPRQRLASSASTSHLPLPL